MEDVFMGAKAITPEGMKNVALSEGTKKYLVAHRMAHRMAQQAADTVSEQIVKDWGDNIHSDKMKEPLWEKLGSFQDEILKLMMDNIREKLCLLSNTEI